MPAKLSKSELLTKLRREANQYQEKIAKERHHLAECEEELNRQCVLLETYMAHRPKSNFRDERAYERSDSNTRILQNRLAKCTTRLNEANEHNRILRNRIDHFRHEKESYDTRHRKLKRDIHKKKRALGRSVEANRHSSSRLDTTRDEMNSIKDLLHREHHDYEAKRILDVDGRCKSGVGSYEQAFMNIIQQSGWDSLSDIIRQFVAHEENVYVTQQCEKELAEKKLEIEKYKQNGHSGVERHKAINCSLEFKLNRAKEVHDVCMRRHTQTVYVLDSLKESVIEMATKLGCDLGAEVSESTLLDAMSIIEERTNDLIEAHTAAVDQHDFNEIKIHSTDDDGIEHNNVQNDFKNENQAEACTHVMSIEELRAKVQASLA